MISYYRDENVEGQITRGLRQRGIDVLTVEDDGQGGRSDPEVIERAARLGRVAFSRDRDFLREAARRQRDGDSFPGVVYAPKVEVAIGRCIEDLVLLAEAGQPDDFQNAVFFLPL